MRMIFTSWKRFTAHQTHNKGNHGIKSPTTSRSHHEPMCQLWQYIRRSSHRADPRRQLRDQRHLQDRSQSHDLVAGGGHAANQLQPLRARIW